MATLNEGPPIELSSAANRAESREEYLNADCLVGQAVSEHVRCCPLTGWLQRRAPWPVDRFGPDQLEVNISENGWLRIAKLFRKLKNWFVL